MAYESGFMIVDQYEGPRLLFVDAYLPLDAEGKYDQLVFRGTGEYVETAALPLILSNATANGYSGIDHPEYLHTVYDVDRLGANSGQVSSFSKFELGIPTDAAFGLSKLTCDKIVSLTTIDGGGNYTFAIREPAAAGRIATFGGKIILSANKVVTTASGGLAYSPNIQLAPDGPVVPIGGGVGQLTTKLVNISPAFNAEALALLGMFTAVQYTAVCYTAQGGVFGATQIPAAITSVDFGKGDAVVTLEVNQSDWDYTGGSGFIQLSVDLFADGKHMASVLFDSNAP